MYPHRIRLRRPWDREPAGTAVRFRRRFGCPTNIDADERVWLTCAGLAVRTVVTLNDDLLAADAGPEACEFDVTALLRQRNELTVTTPGGDAVPQGEFALEVRRTAFLRDVAAVLDGATLTVTGAAVGAAPRELELYVVANRGTAAYGRVAPSAAGTAFRLSATLETPPGSALQVDLVGGAEVWYTWRGAPPAPPSA